MRFSQHIDLILPKLLKVKSELQAVTKSSSNPFFRSKYADLNTHLDAVEPLLEKHKLVLLQPVEGQYVESVILDTESGQFVCSVMSIGETEDIQKAGAKVTYARRYTLGALLSMKVEDDDGETAVGRGGANRKTSPKTTRGKKQSKSQDNEEEF